MRVPGGIVNSTFLIALLECFDRFNGRIQQCYKETLHFNPTCIMTFISGIFSVGVSHFHTPRIFAHAPTNIHSHSIAIPMTHVL